MRNEPGREAIQKASESVRGLVSQDEERVMSEEPRQGY